MWVTTRIISPASIHVLSNRFKNTWDIVIVRLWSVLSGVAV